MTTDPGGNLEPTNEPTGNERADSLESPENPLFQNSPPGYAQEMDPQRQFERLRPIERRVLTMQRDGMSVEEIATRLRRTPQFVERVIEWTRIPRSERPKRSAPSPLERVVLKHRSNGATYEEIGEKLKRSGRFIRQVEGFAHYRKGLRLMSTSAHQARLESEG